MMLVVGQDLTLRTPNGNKSTVRYLGIEVDDALSLSEQVEFRTTRGLAGVPAWQSLQQCVDP